MALHVLVLGASATFMCNLTNFGRDSSCKEDLKAVDEVLAALHRDLDKAGELTRMGFFQSTHAGRLPSGLQAM